MSSYYIRTKICIIIFGKQPLALRRKERRRPYSKYELLTWCREICWTTWMCFPGHLRGTASAAINATDNQIVHSAQNVDSHRYHLRYNMVRSADILRIRRMELLSSCIFKLKIFVNGWMDVSDPPESLLSATTSDKRLLSAPKDSGTWPATVSRKRMPRWLFKPHFNTIFRIIKPFQVVCRNDSRVRL